MATIKLKYRPSSVKGKDGTLYFQIIHLRQVRQIYTGLHISDAEWDAELAAIIMPSDTDSARTRYLSSVNETLTKWRAKLSAVISRFDESGVPYKTQDVVSAYNTPNSVVGLVSFTRKLIVDMRKIGKKSTVKRFGVTLNSLLRYTDGNEVEWNDVTSTFILGYEEYLAKRGLCRNSTSFYMRNLLFICVICAR